ncbi:hypothetical protein TNCV_4641941 [Trichonephila clavipes]|nr:hypothetical protein TNCV_4641941 [Trichonephila clavipes]
MYSAFAAWEYPKQSSSRKYSHEVCGRILTLLHGVPPQNWGGTELNCTVTSTVFKASDNGSRTSIPGRHYVDRNRPVDRQDKWGWPLDVSSN